MMQFEVLATAITFDVPPSQINTLFGSLETSQLYVSSYSRINLGDGMFNGRKLLGAAIEGGDDATASISPATVSSVIPAGERPVRVSISWEEEQPNDVLVALNYVESVTLSPPGSPTSIECSSCSSRQDLLLKNPIRLVPGNEVGEPIHLFSRNRLLRVGIESRPASDRGIDRFRLQSVPVANMVDFYRTGQARPETSIRSGKFRFRETESEVSIGALLIDMRDLSNFRLSDIRLAPNNEGINVRGSGEVGTFKVAGKDALPSFIQRTVGTDRLLAALTLVVAAAGTLVTAIGEWDKIRGFSMRAKGG
jgi:hypothetical protein